MLLEMFLNLKEYGKVMGEHTETDLLELSFSGYPPDVLYSKIIHMLNRSSSFPIVQGDRPPVFLEVYFDSSRHSGTLPLDMREKLLENRWYEVKDAHVDAGNICFDLYTLQGDLEAVCSTWFDKARCTQHSP